jgi:hypothetical protein
LSLDGAGGEQECSGIDLSLLGISSSSFALQGGVIGEVLVLWVLLLLLLLLLCFVSDLSAAAAAERKGFVLVWVLVPVIGLVFLCFKVRFWRVVAVVGLACWSYGGAFQVQECHGV